MSRRKNKSGGPRIGSGILLEMPSGGYLLQKNGDDAPEHVRGKLRPCGGGKDPDDVDLFETAVRELWEELKIPEWLSRRNLKFLGIIRDGDFKGCATFSMHNHGLSPGYFIARNDPEETITMVHADLDHPDYVGQMPWELDTRIPDWMKAHLPPEPKPSAGTVSVMIAVSRVCGPEPKVADDQIVNPLKGGFHGKGGEGRWEDEEFDYQIPTPAHQFTMGDNLIPGANAMKGNRLGLSAKYLGQALSLENPEAPLVDSMDPETGESFSKIAALQSAVRKSPADGTVLSVGSDGVSIKGDDGKTHFVEFHKFFPNGRKTYINDRPAVKLGDKVKAGQAVGLSNFASDDGRLAMGRTLRVAFQAGPEGGTFEDAITISDRASDMLSSQHLYQHDKEVGDATIIDKRKFTQLYPTRYTKDQLAKIDKNGLPLPGVTLEPGDPLFLAVSKRVLTREDASLGRLGKMLRDSWRDESETWDHKKPGMVADAVLNRRNAIVNVASVAKAEVGDKLCLTPDHEVFTFNRGWVPIPDVVVGDRVLSIDLSTMNEEIEEVSKIWTFQMDNEMVFFVRNQEIETVCTMEHRIPSRTDGAVFSPERAENLQGLDFEMIGRSDGNQTTVLVKKHETGTFAYSGSVHCIEVPKNHNFLVRLNGKEHQTSNSARQGAKGVIGRIVPKEKMPRDANGEPIDIFINTAALIGRVNPAMVYEALLGKYAEKTGKPVYVPSFADKPFVDFAHDLLQKSDISPEEELFDPETGRSIGNILTGKQYFMKLEHVASSKVSARGSEGGFDINMQPTKGGEEGAKRVGGLLQTALLSHGALGVVDDAKLRSSNDPEIWRRVRAGLPLPPRKEHAAFTKFLDMMRAAGVRVDKKKDRIDIRFATDRDIDDLGGRPLRSGQSVDMQGRVIPGGLADETVFGGTKMEGWGVIDLPFKVPHPLAESNVAKLLGITGTKLEKVMTGKDVLNGETGPGAIEKALGEIDLARLKSDSMVNFKSGSRTKRDQAVKVLRVIRGLENSKLEPRDLMISKVPVLPAAWRPVVQAGQQTLVPDMNLLYGDLFNAVDAWKSISDVYGNAGGTPGQSR